MAVKFKTIHAFLQKYGTDADAIIIQKFLNKYDIDITEYVVFITQEYSKHLYMSGYVNAPVNQPIHSNKVIEKRPIVKSAANTKLMEDLRKQLPGFSDDRLLEMVEKVQEEQSGNGEVSETSTQFINKMGKHWKQIAKKVDSM